MYTSQKLLVFFFWAPLALYSEVHLWIRTLKDTIQLLNTDFILGKVISEINFCLNKLGLLDLVRENVAIIVYLDLDFFKEKHNTLLFLKVCRRNTRQI